MTNGGLASEERQSWRCRIFASVAQLGDLDYQRATWLDPEMQNPHFSFIEFFECFYDAAGGSYDATDLQAEDAPFGHQVEMTFLSTEEREALWPLHLALKDYRPTDPYQEDVILADRAWHRVVRVAARCANALEAHLSDPIERHMFQNILPPQAQKQWP